MAEVTTTTAAAFLKEVWTKETIDAIQHAQVLRPTVRPWPEADLRSSRTIHIPHTSNLSASTKTEGTDVTFEAITQTNQDITVSTWRYAAFEVNSLVQTQSQYDLIQKYSQKVGYALARGIETDLSALPDNLSTSVGTFGVELTEDDWNTIVTNLDNNSAPDERFAWLSPAAVAAVRKIDKFVSSDFVGGPNATASQTANVGGILGLQLVKSNLLESPSAGQHDCCAFARPQFILAMQKEPALETDRIIESLTDAVVGHGIHAVAEAEIPAEAAGSESLDDEWGNWLKTV